MRVVRLIDFVLQTLLILFALLLVINKGFEPDFNFLMTQLCMGSLQMTGSFVSIIAGGPFHKQKVRHFTLSIVYLISLVIVSQIGSEAIVPASLLLPSWSLAFYYYFITAKRLQLRTSGGKFLPHLNF